MVRLLICEDDDRYRRLLHKILAALEGIAVCGAVATGEAALEAVRRQPPDLLLLDLELPGMSGLEVIDALAGSWPRPEILVLTSFADEQKVFEAVQGGAAGYILKGIAPRQLEQALREVLAGGSVIDARLSRRFWNLFASVQGRSEQDFGLTSEELEVLALVAKGLSNPEAARARGASRRSIKTSLESIYRKLGVTSRVEAAVKGLQAGLIRV